MISALVPISALVNFGVGAILPGVLGAIVLVVEGAQELGAYQRNWTRYRATCEMLRHEKYLYLASAGPYDGIPRNDGKKELALRVDALVSEEHSHWITHMEATKARARERAKAGSVESQHA